jgi:hypothetical protein
MADNSIESRIDELLGKDFQNLTTEEVVQTITGEKLEIPYEDLQSDEGFNKELEKSEKEVEALIQSLEPGPPPIPLSDIEGLACKYEGDSLYSQILLESLKKENSRLYNDLKNSGVLEQKTFVSEDLGVSSNLSSLKNDRKISSEGIVKYLQEKDPDFLEKTNESLFDNVDPLILGKPSNSGSRKKRELNVLGYKVPLVFIMSGKKIAHVKLGGPSITNDQALSDINRVLQDQLKNSKKCDFKDLDLLDIDIPDFDSNGDFLGLGGFRSDRQDGYDANFFPDGNDPIVNDDCDPGLPEDPITGDIISTKQDFEDVADDFCDPPAYDFSGINPDQEDPEPPRVDVDAIQSCIDSALEKANKIDAKNRETARWQMIERNLEEILYHYEIIFEYQKSLLQSWENRFPASNGGDLTNYELGVLILTLIDQETEITAQIEKEQTNIDALKSLFLSNNNVFTQNLFDLRVDDLKLSKTQLKSLFLLKISGGRSLVSYDVNKKDWRVDEGIEALRKNVLSIGQIINESNFIDSLIEQKNEIVDQKDANIYTLEQRTGRDFNINDLENIFADPYSSSSSDLYGQGYDQLEKNEDVFSSQSILNIGEYASQGFDFVESLKDFSVRFVETDFNRSIGELQFKVSFMTDLGNPLPYKLVSKPGKISMDGQPSTPLQEVPEPDQEKIKIGNEHAGNGGLLSEYSTDYLKTYQFLQITNIKTGFPDVANFYDFFETVLNTNTPKQAIINTINSNRGILYGELIEKSASNWLFFSAAERGDNDARDTSKLRPSSFNAEGEPNEVFVDFYGNFKPKWDAKYQQNKQTYIIPKINEIKALARQAGNALGNTLPLLDAVGIRIFENYSNMKRRIEQIEEFILISAQKRTQNEESLSPESLAREFSDLKCAGLGVGGNGEGDGGNVDNNNSVQCPPACCGPAGSDFKFANYLTSSPPSSDCPTIFQRCWWKQFCKDATKVGLLPYPNGLPPIEKPSFFLSPGPSVRLGLKYWPVGYLPPAFIPIPVPNPVDGLPYIRIPLPMIWTIVDPIIIPLPFNLGMIVIFIPFIGGFMPTPLVYLKEFITGSSLFLTGIRGPRFIPRKSDPDLKDPLEKIKQILSFGIPDKLIPLPGFGNDNVDAPSRIIQDLQSNLTKIFDSVPPPGNIDGLREAQQRELELKNSILSKRKEHDKKFALLDVPEPNVEQEREQLDLIIQQRKNTLKNVIKDYLKTGIPNPKSIYFPQDKDKLKIDIPGIVKSLRILKDMKSSFVPIRCGDNINFKDEMREVLKLIRIPSPPKYIIENITVSNSNKIFLKLEKDPRIMEEEEFEDLVKEIRSTSLAITHIILKGNKFSVVKKIRKGAFSIIDDCEKQGQLLFPPVQVTNVAPAPLKITKIKNPLLTAMYLRIMEGMSRIPYTREDFSRYVRYEGENPILVIRVKDLKKLISKKLGLSRRGPFDPERPLDLEEPLVSDFPHPEGPFCCLESLNGSFGNAISAFEIPTVFPPKQDQVSQTQGLGGIVQITIPGTVIKNFIIETVDAALDSGLLEQLIPEIDDINSPKFTNLDPQDIQKIARNMVRETLNPESPNIPKFLDIAKIPVIPKARPTDIIEQALIGMGAPPPARIVYSLFWKYFKGLPKSPLLGGIVNPAVELSSSILRKIPWPLTVLLGRNVINIINPIIMSDDHPSWRRMSLKNTYYVVYMDEFLRSAADVSGLFKFFLGAADPVYPIPELPSELQKAFNVKKY